MNVREFFLALQAEISTQLGRHVYLHETAPIRVTNTNGGKNSVQITLHTTAGTVLTVVGNPTLGECGIVINDEFKEIANKELRYALCIAVYAAITAH